MSGAFVKGNKARRSVATLGSAMVVAVTPDAMRLIIQKFVQTAQEGNPGAMREVLDRFLGKPVEADLVERLDALESALHERKPRWA